MLTFDKIKIIILFIVFRNIIIEWGKPNIINHKIHLAKIILISRTFNLCKLYSKHLNSRG